jgi:hypothetical protein
MRVDPAGHHVLTAGVDHLRMGRRVEVLADGDDLVAMAKNISTKRAVCINDGTAANNGCH